MNTIKSETMKTALLALLFFATLIVACQTSKEEKETDVKEKAETSQCYLYQTEKDTVTLNIVLNGDQITGMLSYQFYEKDANRGSISGIFKGDTLIADYTFKSEGVESVRQVVFLKTDEGLEEGFGESVEVDGKSKFKDINSLKFSENLSLKKTSCR